MSEAPATNTKSPYRHARDRGEPARFPAINTRLLKMQKQGARPAESYRSARRNRFFGRGRQIAEAI